MTTLSVLKARIAEDLARDDIGTPIASAIEDAIEHYRTTRLFFNETRDATFVTVSAQAVYSSADDADIPLFFVVDEMFIVDGTQNHRLRKADPQELEYLTNSTSPSGRPSRWAWFDRSIRLYPVPNAVYTIRPEGAIEKASPAADATTGNVWMLEAFALLRCRAKKDLYLHVIYSPEKAALMDAAERRELRQLRRRNTMKALGSIEATTF